MQEPQIDVSELRHATVSIYDLVPSPDNYNEHPPEQVESLKASLRRFSQVEDVIVKALPDGKYQIVAHEGVTTAALELLEEGECPHLAQWNIIIVPDSWSDLDVKGYMIASNETARISTSDEELLAHLLQEQQEAGFDLDSMGTDEDALNDMLAKLHPPSLDDLTDEYGDEPLNDAFWPVIRVKVPPETKELYDSLLEDAEGKDDGAKFTWLLERVNIAQEEKV